MFEKSDRNRGDQCRRRDATKCAAAKPHYFTAETPYVEKI